MADPDKTVESMDSNDGDVEEVEIDDDTKPILKDSFHSQLMKNPALIAAVQSKLGSMVGAPSGYIASLPKPVKRRIKALKKIQLEATKIESMFYDDVHVLECKYAKQYQPLYDKRHSITAGLYEPNDEESEWPSDEEKFDEALAEDVASKVKIEDDVKESDTRGIPEFWLTIFKNVEMLAENVQEHDEPILRHLKDIRVKFTERSPMGFVLEFHFEPNDFFSNTVLTKEYEMKCTPDENDPFSFEGPEIYKCKGCVVDWKKGKNVTVRTIKKKQKHKSRGSVRTVTKTVQNDSFFNFFAPPAIPDDDTELDGDTEALLAADFEIGHFIRERIVPRAVLYFTGEALDDEEFDDDEEGDDEDGDNEDDEDEENDPDFNPSADKLAKKGQNPSECKQQ